MTIEAKLDQTNKLLGEILARLSSASPASAAPQLVPAATTASPASATAINASSASATTATEAPAPAEIDYKRHIQAPLIALAKAKGGDFARSVFAEWGVPKADKVPSTDWPKLVGNIVAAIATLTADEKAKAGL